MKKLVLVALLAGASGLAVADVADDALGKGGCLACHAKDKKIIGPAFKDVAAKLFDKVRKGGSGSFGPIPMSPNGPDKIDDAGLKAAIEAILKL